MDLRDIERAALGQGWRVERTRKGHPRFVPPDPMQPIIIGSGTPGSQRSIRELLARMRRCGFIWPPPT